MATLVGLLTTFSCIAVFTFISFVLLKKKIANRTSLLSCALASAFAVLFAIGALSVFFAIVFSKIAIWILILISLIFVLKSEYRSSFIVVLKKNRVSFYAWLLLAVITAGFSGVNVQSPSTLPDGAYVFKNWSKPVEMQVIAGDLPMDNALPYYTAEFLVRNQDLQKDQPIMPGQEIILRTYGMSFAYLAMRSLYTDDAQTRSIERFNYVGTEWPDVRSLYVEKYYGFFNGVMFVLVSFLGFVLVQLYRFSFAQSLSKVGVFFIATTPFILNQTYFTWSKNLVVAFAILMFQYRRERNFLAKSIFVVVGFFVHPMILIFVVATILYDFFLLRRIPIQLILSYLIVDVLWRLYGVTTGLKSNLIQQSLLRDQPIWDHIQARIVTFANFFTFDYLRIFPVNLQQMYKSFVFSSFSFVCLCLLLTFLLHRKLVGYSSLTNKWFVFGGFSILVATAIYSTPAPVIMFGGQILFFITTLFLVRNLKNSFLLPILVFFNVFISAVWLYALNPISYHLI